MSSTSQSSQRRQPAILLFALEYTQASLPEGGEGQYDPTFIVTKLGARVSRMMVAGVIDRMERQDGDNGPRYRGQLRDPTGAHMFDIGHFQPELHAEAEELVARFERGDRFLMLMMGRARHWTTEEGSVFTSIRTESMKVIERDRYAVWLAAVSDATLRRIDAYERGMDEEAEPTALRAAGVPTDLIDGQISSRGHYGSFDPESYRVGVLHALGIASGRTQELEPMPPDTASSAGEEAAGGVTEDASAPVDAVVTGPVEPAEVILEKIRSDDAGEGVHYDDLMRACKSKGIELQAFENSLDDLRDTQCEIIEPNFGWFRLLPTD